MTIDFKKTCQLNDWKVIDVFPRVTSIRIYQPPRQNVSADMCLTYISIRLGASLAPISIRRYGPPSAVDIKRLNQVGSFRVTNRFSDIAFCRCIRPNCRISLG